MAKTGRKPKYETDIKPHLKTIEDAVKQGATVTEIAHALGIAESTLYKYKAEKTELSKAFACGRGKIVIDIRAALLKKALGFTYEEEKKVARIDDNGNDILLVEKHKKYQPPSETAAAMLLRNYDEKWLDKDNTTTQLKEKEFALRQKIADSDNFDL